MRLTRSVRKFIRREKARIRKTTPDRLILSQKIVELYGRFGVK